MTPEASVWDPGMLGDPSPPGLPPSLGPPRLAPLPRAQLSQATSKSHPPVSRPRKCMNNSLLSRLPRWSKHVKSSGRLLCTSDTALSILLSSHSEPCGSIMEDGSEAQRGEGTASRSHSTREAGLAGTRVCRTLYFQPCWLRSPSPGHM